MPGERPSGSALDWIDEVAQRIADEDSVNKVAPMPKVMQQKKEVCAPRPTPL
jgi:hypothetical protein